MPIYKYNDKPVVQLGYGDILISIAKGMDKECYNEIILHQTEETMPIGDTTQKYAGKDTDQFKDCIRLIFDKTESIDVLVEELGKLKVLMLEKK